MTVVCPHTAISAKRSAWLLWRMGTVVQFGYYGDGEEDNCVLRVQAREKILLISSLGASVASALTNGFLCVPFFSHRMQGVEERE